MSLDLRYPVVMQRLLHCSKCQRHTQHDSVIYPDVEYNTCETCNTKHTIYYNRSVAVLYEPVDMTELEGIENDLNNLAGEIFTRDFGHIGKKDWNFINHIRASILSIRRRVERLKERKNDL